MQRKNSITSGDPVIKLLKDMQKDISALQTKSTGPIAFVGADGIELQIGAPLTDGTVAVVPFVGDTTPPPVATPPLAVSTPGSITVSWDGLFVAGAAKPRDFENLNVFGYQMVSGAAVKTVEVGMLRAPLDAVIVSTDVAGVAETWQFAFVSKDYNGNLSVPSARSLSVVQQSFASDAIINTALANLNTSVSTAQTAANTAQTAAGTAQTAADNAAQSALDASNLAGSKGKVLIQSAAPGIPDQLAQNLWIDTTGGANTPKRWNGSAWITVTDKIATDAASAAATAQTKADQAFNNAATASTAAGNAQTSADGKNRNWYQTAAPAGTAHKDGDIWYDTDDGNKIYLWKTSTLTWTAFQDGAISVAQTAANNAATAATNAQTAANTAQTNAATAQTAADLANTQVTAVIAAGSNLTLNGDFELPSPQGWPSRTLTYIEASAGTARSGTNIMRASPNTSSISYAYSDYVSSSKDRVFYVEFYIRLREALVAGNENLDVGAYFTSLSSAGVVAASPQTGGGSLKVGALSTTTWSKFSITYKVTQTDNIKIKFGPRVPTLAVAGNSFEIDDFKAVDITTAQAALDAAATAQTKADQAFANAATAATAAGTAQTAADGKNTVWYQTAAPAGTGHKVGDTWFDTDDGNRINRWNGSVWVDAQDTAILAAKTQADVALTSANGKNKTYYQTAQPSGGTYITGDMWFDTDDSYKLYTYTGSAWQVTQDSSTALTTANSKVKTFIQSTAPTATTTGDLWIDTANGNQIKRWSGSAWVDARDTTIATAQTQANTALTSANGKNRVYYQTAMPTGGTYIIGDTWFDTDDGNKIYVHNGTTFIASQLGSNAIADLAITNAKIGDATIQSAKIGSVDAGTITVGTLSAGRIGAKTITTDKLVIGAADNLIVEPDFTAAGVAWAVTGAYSVDATGARNGGPAWKIVNAASQQGTYNKPQWVPIEGGQSYRMTAWVKADVDIPLNGVTLYITTKNAAGSTSIVAAGNIAATLAATWTLVTGKRTLPADAVSVSFGVYSQSNLSTGNLWVDFVSASRMAGGELIVDGAIQAGSLIVGTGAIGTAHIGDASITNVKIVDASIQSAKIGSVDAGTITVGTLSAARIAAGSMTADKLIVASNLNALPDPAFSNAAMNTARTTLSSGGTAGWTLNNGTSTGIKYFTRTTGTANDTFTFHTVSPSTSNAFIGIPVVAGQVWRLSIDVGTSVSAGVRWNVYRWFADGTQTFTSLSPYSTGVGQRTLSYAYTIPAGVVAVSFALACDTSACIWDVYGNAVIGQKAPSTLISDGAILTAHMTSGTIDASVISAGSITAPLLSSKSITADKMLITSTDNLIHEADFSGGGASWDLTSGFVINATAGRNSLPAMVLTNAASLQTSFNAVGAPTKAPIEFTSDGGNAYRVSAWLKSTVAVPVSGAYVSARFRSTTGTYTTISMPYTTPGTQTPATLASGTYGEIAGIVTAPANTISVAFSINTASAFSTGVVTWDVVSATRASTGELIVDGAITAAKIAVGAITTGSMTAGTIDASVITSGTITSTQIKSKSITVDDLVVTSTDNLVVEADFGNLGSSWSMPTYTSIQPTAGRGTLPAMRFTGTVSEVLVVNLVNKFTVDSDARFRGAIMVKSDAALAIGKVQLRLRCYTTATAYTDIVVASNTVALVANTWTSVAGISPDLPANTIAAEALVAVTNVATGTITYTDYVSLTRAMSGDLIVDGAITADKILANSITSDKIVAKTITADKLLIAGGRNLAYNGSADATNTAGYSGFVRQTTNKPAGFTAAWNAPTNTTATINFLDNPKIEVKPNTTYKVVVWMKADKTGSNVYLENVTGSTAAGERTNPIYSYTAWPVPITWTRYVSVPFTTGTAPANTLYFRWFLNHTSGTVFDATFSFTGFELVEMQTGELIVDGAIDGKIITGATIQSEATASRGVKIDSTGISAYDGAGATTFNVNATTGIVTTVGRLYTSVAGQAGIAIIPPADSYNGLDMSILFATDSHSLPGTVTAGLWMTDPGASGAINLNMRGANGAGVSVWNGLSLLTSGVITSSAEIKLASSFNVVADAGSGKQVRLQNAGAAYNQTIGYSANMYLHTDGNIFKSTSSLRYKQDVRDWSPGMKALNLQPRTWVGLNEIESMRDGQRYVGFIAEEVQEILPELVLYDELGRPDALSYDRFSAAIIPILQNIVSRLDAAGL